MWRQTVGVFTREINGKHSEERAVPCEGGIVGGGLVGGVPNGPKGTKQMRGTVQRALINSFF